MAHPSLVPPLPIAPRGAALNFQARQQTSFFSLQDITPPSCGDPYIGCRNVIREAFLRKNHSADAAEVLLASLSESTLKQYNSCLREWWSFCQTNNHNIYEINTIKVLEFLTKKFNEGASYGTLNSTRSAISLLSDNSLSNDSTMSRFFKGVFRLRPQAPKYESTWDPEVVFKYIENLPPLSELTFQQISEKTIILLALSTAHRAQTFQLININNILSTQSGLEIKIPELIKTSKPGRTQPNLVLPFFKERPKLCVATAILDYLKVSEKLRAGCNNLFISTRKPYAAVSTPTISRWIKLVLSKAGIDVNTFTAHSTRHAAVSTAFQRGIDLSTIKNAAGWSQNSIVFAKFYNRPIKPSNDTFAKSIFQR